MHKFFTIFLVTAGLLATKTAGAQSLGNSPYSRLGIGEMNNSQGSIRNFSMGGTGIASPSSAQINELNPALLYFNNNVIFEMSVTSQLKSLKETDRKQVDGSATLNTIALGIPLSKSWTAAIGIKPFSTVNYESNTSQPIIGDPNTIALVKYSGEGGLSEAYFAHGVKVVKDLTLGVTGSYIFGTTDNMYASTLQNTSFQQILIRQQTHYSDFLFKTGMAYRHKVGKYNAGIGAVYNFGTKLDAERRTVLETLQLSGVSSIVQDSATRPVTLPSGFQVGFSLDNATNWSINADLATQQWSEFKSYEGNKDFVNSMRIGLGGEYVPEPGSPKYFRRVAYRAGFTFGQTPYQITGKQLNETAVTWGFTFPLGRPNITESYFLNLGFALGKRGTTDNNLVQENFIRMQAGFSLNNKWFIKRKLD